MVGKPVKGYRLSSGQLAKEKAIAATNKAAFDAAYVAATLEWQQMVREGKCGKGDACADAVARWYTMTLPSACTTKITGRSLKHAVKAGRCGQPQSARGNRVMVSARTCYGE